MFEQRRYSPQRDRENVRARRRRGTAPCRSPRSRKWDALSIVIDGRACPACRERSTMRGRAGTQPRMELERLRRELRARDAERFAIAPRPGGGRARTSSAWQRRAPGVGATLQLALARAAAPPTGAHEGAVARALDRRRRLERVLTAPEPAPDERRAPPRSASASPRASREAAQLGGDFHFAAAIARELERRGHPARVQVLPAEGTPGRTTSHRPARGAPPHAAGGAAQRAVGHQPPGRRSPPPMRRLRPRLRGLGGSPQTLREQTSTPVIVLHQATDPGVFHPDRPGRARARVRRQLARCATQDPRRSAADEPRARGVWQRLGGVIDPASVVATCAERPAAPRLLIGGDRAQRPLGRHARARVHLQPRLRRRRLWRFRPQRSGRRYRGAVRGRCGTYETREELAQLVERFLADPVERQPARRPAGARSRGAHVRPPGRCARRGVTERAQTVGISPAITAINEGRS